MPGVLQEQQLEDKINEQPVSRDRQCKLDDNYAIRPGEQDCTRPD